MSTNQSALTFITESLPTFFVGQPTQFDIEASGGTTPYTFEITQGALPNGLTFNDQGRISGSPTAVGGPITIFVKVTDYAGSNLTQAFDVQVSDSQASTAEGSTLTFITESLPAFVVGETTQFDIEVGGGTTPYTFEITQGALPDGLTFNDQGRISGSPTAVGDPTTIFVKVTDTAGSNLTQAFDVQVSEGQNAEASRSTSAS